jgi:membrane fusion protein (multidrug efflux system)
MSQPTPNAPQPVDPQHQLPAPGHATTAGPSGGGGGGHDDHGGVPADLTKPGNGTVIGVVGLFVLLLAGLFIVGFVPSHREETQTRSDAAERATAKPAVLWAHPITSTGEKDVQLPCDVTAYQQTALYTRTNGYLKEWHFDIGQHVEKGQLMAVIDTPEVDAELEQSKATLEQNKANVLKSQADLDLARVTLARYVDSQKTSPGSVTQEQVDQERGAYDDAVAGLKQVEATVTQAQANVDQLQTLVNFEKIIAPFTGTVTARNYDVGALLSPPTSSASAPEIFDLQQTDKLRVFVNVPQTYANNIKQGQEAYLSVVNFPGRQFKGKVALTAGAVNPNTRTLRVQIDFDNPNGELFAGAYGQVKLPVTPQQQVSIISSSALVYNAAGTEVATLGAGDKVHIKTVTLGRDLGTELQVTSGLSPEDRVIINPGERTTEGAEVAAREAPQDAPAKAPATRPAMAATGSEAQPNVLADAAPAPGR